ncbi:hypothetical protein [Rhizobium leguminosarum]|uniref:hypothetical protein n=1 Tax=Rhizobium leguminosarum TaxID=384 RepID=UPI0007C724CB|nr:hypothetical protein [Rhizobium leguminosarum]
MEDHLNNKEWPPISLDDLILHDHVLDAYPWLSAQILNRWRRKRAIRAFTGKEGKIVYPKADLAIAITQEMECENNDQTEGSSSTAASGSERSRDEPASIATGTMTEADALREKLYLERISSRRKKSS